MNAIATAANAAWWASNLPSWWAFRAALHNPAATQRRLLQSIVSGAARTAFGRDHRFNKIQSYADFVARVPIREYAEFEPYIDRIRRGEQHVLTADRVIRFATTSGTTSGRKLIPYTRRSQAEFNRAVGPWIADLFHTYPSLVAGSAYWSISPVVQESHETDSKVPIGFEDDSEYLGGLRRRLVDSVMAVPNSVRHAGSMGEWRRQTADHLAKASDLRLISIWHPSFLSLLGDQLDRPMFDVWPHLKVISCWTDAHAALGAAELSRQFPDVVIQPKGLIATEAIVSIPFAGRWPLAIRSHFYEFIGDDGSVWRADELREGHGYEVVVTTGSGLFRYRLGDRVVVEGRVAKTPSIRFLGKANNVSDRFGEKLSEPFVATILDRVQRESGVTWTFAMLAPEGSRYVLFVAGDVATDLAERIDAALRDNPHYAYCRDLRQLQSVEIIRLGMDAPETFARRMTEMGQRLGDIKPVALSRLDGWGEWFASVAQSFLPAFPPGISLQTKDGERDRQE